jgi:O-acetyl-ADP-ribose deacetylase (regulator of RNase III)
MAADNEARRCFVIMPYGVRKDADGNEIDFDRVYEDVIKKSVAGTGLVPVRGDEIRAAGSIHREMFERIAQDEAAVVDISLLNANVFYELGVRHALRPAVTVLIKNRNTTIPFNINSERVIEYPAKGGSYDEARDQIRQFIETGLKSTAADSPIFTILQEARKDWKAERITTPESHAFRMRDRPDRQIVIITGDIRERRDIDVWVNSENTNMQMARFYERALSAIIRYEGARKDDQGEIVEDTIAIELRQATNGREFVRPGAIYVTGSGELAQTRGVKKIFHAAAVTGVPGGGYVAIHEVERIVTTALERMDRDGNLRSIAFPMLGTGVGGADVTVVGPGMVNESINYFLRTPGSQVQSVYLMAWNYRDLDACRKALEGSERVTRA